MSNHHRAGALAAADTLVTVTPEQAGWAYSGLEVFDLAAGAASRVLDGVEGVLVPLSATDVRVTVDGDTHTLRGRNGVFAAVSDWMYLPVGSAVEITAASGEVALCTARATERFPVQRDRGRGRAGRGPRRRPRLPPGHEHRDARLLHRRPQDQRLRGDHPRRQRLVVAAAPARRHRRLRAHQRGDLLLPDGPRSTPPHGHPHGQGLFRVYTVDGSVDETVTVLDGDVYLVPQGYHGPSTAQPEYPMYFLNVLAGPAEDRTMAFCDDPDHHWIREAWDEPGPGPPPPDDLSRTGG